MVRKILTAGLVLLAGCPIPSTLGLPCEDNSHCDRGQSCVGDVCEMGQPDDTMPPMTMPPVTMSGTDTADDTSSTTDDTATSTSESPTSSTTASESSSESSSSTGLACGVDACVDLDILLIVDNSDSMDQWLLPLANSLPTLFDLFDNELANVCTFHVGIVNAEQMPQTNTVECQFPGALIQRLESCGGKPGDRPYYSEEDGSPSDAFTNLQCTFINQGFGGDPDERMLEAMLGALDPKNNAEGACNDGFRRPGAELALLYLSDENDPTPMDEQDTVAELFQSYVDPSLVVFIAVVGDPANEDPQCQWMPDGEGEGSGAEVPSALNGFLALSGIPVFQQARVDICQSEAYEFEDAFNVFASICR